MHVHSVHKEGGKRERERERGGGRKGGREGRKWLTFFEVLMCLTQFYAVGGAYMLPEIKIKVISIISP